MSSRLSTAGMSLQYCVETTAGTMPTTGYTTVDEIKSIPSFNPQPETIDSTTLAETEFRTYVAGLKDMSGALEFGANLTDDLITAWGTLITAYATGQSATPAKATWFAVVHPKLSKAVYFKGEPSPIGLDGASVGSMLETTLYITPQSAPTLAAKPTVGT